MVKALLPLLFVLLLAGSVFGQSHKEEIVHFQKALHKEFLNPAESPLSKEQMKKFSGHSFFPIDPKYKVIAKFVRADKSVPFQMQTTTDRLPTYEKYGEAIFELDGELIRLNIYQSHQLRETKKYKNYLFLPFTDETNGKETYGGGRYIDLSIPTGNTIVIDFNKAYNPFCAYNPSRSCPIPPKSNALGMRILAGVKAAPEL